MSKERIISSYTDNKFLNVPSNSLFTYGSFNITSNFDNKKTKNFDNKLISFVTPITLESIGLSSKDSDLINNVNNNILLNLDRTDLNTFVRFGSAYEFLRISLENIILSYPGSLYFDSQRNSLSTIFNYSYDNYNNISTLYLVGDTIVNKFGITYDSNDLTFEIGKELKNLNNSFSNYDLWFPNDINKLYNIIGFTGKTSTQNWIIIKVSGEIFSDSIDTKLDLHIKPNNVEYNKFYLLLSDYERFLLSKRNGITDFSFKLKDPTLQDDGEINYVDTKLKWYTKDGYNIDIDTIQYQKLLDILLTIGNKYDNIKTDLIARFLSPTSLKTYDLTEEGKVSKLLRIYGYEFDKLREFIDSMVNINKLSYNKIDNVPDQLISNLSKVLGWNYSTIVSADEFINNVLNVDSDNIQNNLLPSDIDIELWRRILINTNYFWKSKGTRESVKSLLLLLGIPEQFINITEYIYTVDGKINPNEAVLVPIDYPTNSLPYDDLGYPKAVLETNDFYFQISGDTDSGQAYMNTFRTAGFNLNLTIDNKKSWVMEGDVIRTGSTTPSYHQQDSRLVLNTKEIDLSLDTIQGIENDIYTYFKNNPSGFTDTYGVGDISNLSFLEFINIVQKKLVNVKNRKTITDFKGGWYPALFNLYIKYIDNTIGYNYDLVYSFISRYGNIFDNFVKQVIPTTVIIRNGGFILRNSIFNKQKFMYRRGTYMGTINKYGGLSGETIYDIDNKINYLGDDGAMYIRPQYSYVSNFLDDGVCQHNGISYTGNRLFSNLIVIKTLDAEQIEQKLFKITDSFNINDKQYNLIPATGVNSLKYYTDTMYIVRYNDFIKYINNSFYTGFENNIIPYGIVSDNICVPTTTEYIATTTEYIATTTEYIATTTYLPTTTINNCVQINEELGYSYISSTEACNSIIKNSYYGNNNSFSLTTKISSSNSCLATLSGYYSNGGIWKYTADGINFITGGVCNVSPTTTSLDEFGLCYNIKVPVTELENSGTLYIDYYPYGEEFTSLPYTQYDNISGDPNYFEINLCSTFYVFFRRNGVEIVISESIITTGSYGCISNNECSL